MKEILLATPTTGEFPENWMPPSNETLDAYAHYRQLGLVATNAIPKHPAAQIPKDAIQSRATREVVDKLFRVAEKQRELGRRLVGLAAPQLGIDARIFIADVTAVGPDDLGELAAFINPQIQNHDEEVPGFEGCFSCLLVSAQLKRSRLTSLTAWNTKGEHMEGDFEGYNARILQHEYDHLEGYLFPDRAIAEGARLDWLPPELKDEYFAAAQTFKDQGQPEWHWPYTVPVTQWEAMSKGAFSFDNFTASPPGGPVIRFE